MSVYTQITKINLDELLDKYNLGKLVSFEGIISGTTNSNYAVSTDKNKFILTIFENLNNNDLDFYLQWLIHLGNCDLPCAPPIADKNNIYIHELHNKPAVFMPMLPGKEPIKINIQQCINMGEILAKIHLASDNFILRRQNDFDNSWHVHTADTVRSLLTPDQQKLLDQELSLQLSLDNKNLPKGIIHADLFRDNTLFTNDNLSGVIDFYFSCYDDLLLDIATCINDWCIEDQNYELTRVQAFLQGYEQIRKLENCEYELFPKYLQRAALRFWLSRLKAKFSLAENNMIQIKDPNEFELILNIASKFTL